jgi:hypothetical protein
MNLILSLSKDEVSRITDTTRPSRALVPSGALV